jgi:hypothetical protein
MQISSRRPIGIFIAVIANLAITRDGFAGLALKALQIANL